MWRIHVYMWRIHVYMWLQIDGEETFSIPMSDIKTNIEQHLNYDWLVVEANVTETLTGITLNGSSEIQFFDTAEKLDFVQSLPKDYKPGLLYTAYVSICVWEAILLQFNSYNIDLISDIS
jgi:hypothetical protein